MTGLVLLQITVVSLYLIKVSFVILDVANLKYGCKPTLKIVVRKTLAAFTCKQLASSSKHS